MLLSSSSPAPLNNSEDEATNVDDSRPAALSTVSESRSPKERSNSLFAVSGNADFDEIMTSAGSPLMLRLTPGSSSRESANMESPPELSLEGYPLLPRLADRKHVFEPPPVTAPSAPSSSSPALRRRASSDPSSPPQQRTMQHEVEEEDSLPVPQPLSPPTPAYRSLADSAPIPPPPTTTNGGGLLLPRALKPRVNMLMRRSSAASHDDGDGGVGGDFPAATLLPSPRRTFVISPFRTAAPSPAVPPPPPPPSGIGLRRSTSLSSFLFAPSSSAPTITTTTTTTPTPVPARPLKPISRRVSSEVSFSAILQRLRSSSADLRRHSVSSSTGTSPQQQSPPPTPLLEPHGRQRRASSSVFEDPGRALPSQSVTSSTSEDQHASYATHRRDTLDQASEDYEEDEDDHYNEEEEEEEEDEGAFDVEEEEEDEPPAPSPAPTPAPAATVAPEDGIPDYATLPDLLTKICQVKDRVRRAFWLDALFSSAPDFTASRGANWFTQTVVRFVNTSRQIDVLDAWLLGGEGNRLRTCLPFVDADAELMIVLSSFPQDDRTAAKLTQQVHAMRALLAPPSPLKEEGERSQSFGGGGGDVEEEEEEEQEERRRHSCGAQLGGGGGERAAVVVVATEPYLARMMQWAVVAPPPAPSPLPLPPAPPQHHRSNSGGGGHHHHSRQSSFGLKRGASFSSSLSQLFQFADEPPPPPPAAAAGVQLRRMDPKHVAELLMRTMYHHAYQHLSPRTLRTVHARKQDAHVQRMVRLFEVLSYWPASEILSDARRTASERVDDFGFFCHVARASRELGNFHAVFALVGSLQSPLLRWVEDLVASKRDKAEFRSLQRLCRTDNNYKVYYADLSKRDAGRPCVPYLGLLNRTLLVLQGDSAPLFSQQDESKVNFLRIRRTWKELAQYLAYQQPAQVGGGEAEAENAAVSESMARAVLDYGELTALSLQAKASYKKSRTQRAFHRARAMGHQIVGSPDGGGGGGAM